MKLRVDLALLAVLDDVFLSYKARGVSVIKTTHGEIDTLQIYVEVVKCLRFCPIFIGIGVDRLMLL
jgi:hypothetical protein